MKKLRSYRLEESLIDEIDSYAKERGSSATEVVAAGARHLLDLAKGGVPDLPVDPRPADLHPGTPMPAWTPAVQTEIEEARAEHARNLGVRQRALNARKERASR